MPGREQQLAVHEQDRVLVQVVLVDEVRPGQAWAMLALPWMPMALPGSFLSLRISSSPRRPRVLAQSASASVVENTTGSSLRRG